MAKIHVAMPGGRKALPEQPGRGIAFALLLGAAILGLALAALCWRADRVAVERMQSDIAGDVNAAGDALGRGAVSFALAALGDRAIPSDLGRLDRAFDELQRDLSVRQVLLIAADGTVLVDRPTRPQQSDPFRRLVGSFD